MIKSELGQIYGRALFFLRTLFTSIACRAEILCAAMWDSELPNDQYLAAKIFSPVVAAAAGLEVLSLRLGLL